MNRVCDFSCYVKSCYFNDLDGGCEKQYGPSITEDELTVAGFLPMCRDYQEKEVEEGCEDG